jgi:hypothetical protein
MLKMRELSGVRNMTIRAKYTVAGLLLTGLLSVAVSLAAQARNNLPDAQVQSSVLKALAGAQDLSTQNIQTQTVYGTVTLSGNVHDEAMRTKAENLVSRVQGVQKVVDQLQLGDTPPPADVADQSGAGPQGQQPQDQAYDGPPPSGGQPGPQGPPPPGRQPLYAEGSSNAYAPPPGVRPGQRSGMPVVVPAGAPLQIRVNRGMDSNHTPPGTPFEGIVMNDVVANGAVAIPRGATVQGTVIDSKKAGTFKGQGELTLQINSLQLGGQMYPLTTNLWSGFGHDKTAGTVGRTAGTSAFGALVGALAGGGEGAAIGAAAGAGVGLASSAGGPRGEIIVVPEAILSFTVAQPLPVQTVSQAEMSRLSYAAGPTQPPPPRMRRVCDPYRGCYFAPVAY